MASNKCSAIMPGRGTPVVDPKRFSKWRVPTSKVILSLTPRFFDLVNSMADSVLEADCPGIIFKCSMVEYGGARILSALLFWGAPAAIAGFERIVAAGGEEFIVLGLAGSIHPRARIGDIVVPAWGVREEGTSYHYMPPDYVPEPDSELASRLYSMLKVVKGRRRHRLLRGGIWSTDAIFRETIDKVEKYSSMGVYVVDMEMTALFAVAHYRKVKLAGVIAVSDELFTGEWKTGFEDNRLKRAEWILVEAALRSLSWKG